MFRVDWWGDLESNPLIDRWGLIKNSGIIPAEFVSTSRTTGVLLIQRSVSRASWERGNGLENFHPLICIRSASACHCTHIFTDRLVTLYDYTSNGSISDQNRLFRPLRAAPWKSSAIKENDHPPTHICKHQAVQREMTLYIFSR